MNLMIQAQNKLANVLLIEDNPGDVRLTQEAIKEGELPIQLNICRDGEEAIHYLRKIKGFEDAQIPQLILLDLNLPRKDGREVLEEIKSNPDLKKIPVIVLTTSNAEQDVNQCYDLHANCFITKPVDYQQFFLLMQQIDAFWLNTVALPK